MPTFSSPIPLYQSVSFPSQVDGYVCQFVDEPVERGEHGAGDGPSFRGQGGWRADERQVNGPVLVSSSVTALTTDTLRC